MKSTSLQTRAKALALTLGAGALLGVGSVFADDLRNDLDATIDASLETMNLVEGGANGTLQYSVIARDSDGADGCNLSTSAALGVNVSSSDPSVATVSPASLNFTSCADVKTITVTPVNGGSAEITLTQTANGSAGSFNLSAASFVAVVADVPPTDTTPPVIVPTLSPVPNAAGWNNGNVMLSWAVSDPESDIDFKAGCATRDLTRETRGTRFTCVAGSDGGVSRKTIKVMIDKTDPFVMIRSPRNGAEFALNQKVHADWSAFDARSGIAVATGTKADGELLDTSTLGTHTFSVTATDRAGNSVTKEVSYTVSAGDEDQDDDEGEEGDEDENGDEEDEDRGDRGDRGRGHVLVCHKGHVTLDISLSALRAHVQHGDNIGRCAR